MDLVDEVGVFDGVAQAVGATKRDGGGGLYERAGSHDGCGCNSHCENPHEFLLRSNVPTAPPIARSNDSLSDARSTFRG